MPKNKQNKGIVSRQDIIYAELRCSRFQQKKRKPQTDHSDVMSSEQPVTYMELKCHKSHLQHRKWFLREKRNDSQSPAWQIITGSLGVLCVVLMATVGFLVANLFVNKEELNKKISLVSTPSSMNECSRNISLDHWIGFGNSYYHYFIESKTWSESHAACKELNSHLVKTDIKEKLDILTLFGMEGWIGLKTIRTDGPWLWEDGTQINHSLLTFSVKKKHRCAYVRGIYIYSDNCLSGKSYVCELRK